MHCRRPGFHVPRPRIHSPTLLLAADPARAARHAREGEGRPGDTAELRPRLACVPCDGRRLSVSTPLSPVAMHRPNMHHSN